MIIASFFKSHPKFGDDISDPDWRMIEFTGWGGSEIMGYFLPAKGDSKGLILYMHGYSSSLGRAEKRILHLRDQGFDVAGTYSKNKIRYCSAWSKLKLNTKIGLHTTTITTHPPPTANF